MENPNKKLLVSGLEDISPYSIIVAKPVDQNTLVDYFKLICQKHAKLDIKNILELRPSAENSVQVALRNEGFDVESVQLSPDLHAISTSKSGKQEFVLGETTQLPENLKGKFDAIFAPFGSFGLIQQEIDFFIHQCSNLLKKNGIFCAEIWQLSGVEDTATTETGFRNWSEIEKDDTKIIRFTSSFLSLNSSTLQTNIQYLIENPQAKWEKYKESHIWRVYSLSELKSLFENAKFDIEGIYRHLSLQPPELKSFRLTLVAINTYP